jgi:hypothetical protein
MIPGIAGEGQLLRAQHPLEPTAPSALVVSRLFDFFGGLVQNSGFAHPAPRLSFSVGRRKLPMFGVIVMKDHSATETAIGWNDEMLLRPIGEIGL